jgi:hypothetical protein
VRKAHKILVGEPEGKRSLRRPKLRWEDNIIMDLRERGWGRCGLDESGLGYKTVADTSEDNNELSGSTKGWEYLD